MPLQVVQQADASVHQGLRAACPVGEHLELLQPGGVFRTDRTGGGSSDAALPM
ncbi:hypothetical protein [Streptomyces sp. NPDC007856]|uniref:hypothetical protein n=1 Tax=Streptomyces sp. NPDC007856 TaxID=3364781 RepID=UPI0036775763